MVNCTAGVALVLMALFFIYQTWGCDSTAAHMQEQDKGSDGLSTPSR